MPMGGSVLGGQLEIFATTVSIPSGRMSGIGTTRIVVDDKPPGMLTSQGNCGESAPGVAVPEYCTKTGNGSLVGPGREIVNSPTKGNRSSGAESSSAMG